MAKNAPENRLKDLELELSNMESLEKSASLKKEISFRQAIENSIPSGIAVIDDKGKQVYVNKSFCSMTGWGKDELLDKHPPYVYWSPQDMININDALDKTLNNKAPEEGFDLYFINKKGKTFPVNVIISPFLQEDSRVFWLANVIDISKRKKVEDALAESRLLLKSSLESLKETIIFSIDKKYNYLLFNRTHHDAMKFAYDKDIKTGMNFLDCITIANERILLKEKIDRALAGESTSLIQTFGKTNIDYYEVSFNPIEDKNGEVIGCTGLARNISIRKEAEIALKESETKFKEIIEQSNDGIIVFDEDAKIVIWNKGIERISGLKANDTLNRNISDVQFGFTPPGTRTKAQINNRIKEIISLQKPEIYNQLVDTEIISQHSPGLRNIQSTVFPIKLDKQNLFCAIIRDTTEIKRYEKELQKNIEEKDKFYSVITQYLYTPFSLFNNFSKIMAEEMDTLPVKEIQKMAVMMSKSATNLYSLLDNLLQWTRMNQGKITFSPQKLNFKTISHESVSILKPLADAKNIKINHHIGEEITINADLFMLKTILRNLVSNAIKFTDHEGQINISALQTDENVLISVSDNGIGIAPENITKLFNISNISKPLGMEEEKGTSLGLLLCKKFVENHEGKIWVESNNGTGSDFKFSMPAYKEMSNKSNN